MRRTQIYLPEHIYKSLGKIKARRQVSIAQIIRETLEKHLEAEETNMTPALLELAKLNLRGGPRDLSRKIDEYLYNK